MLSVCFGGLVCRGRVRGGSCRLGRGSAIWRWRSVLAGALGLEHVGVELSVAAVSAFGEGLGVVFEGIGWWLGAFVDDLQEAARGGFRGVAFKLVEDKGDVGSGLLDGAGLDEAFDAKLAVI